MELRYVMVSCGPHSRGLIDRFPQTEQVYPELEELTRKDVKQSEGHREESLWDAGDR